MNKDLHILKECILFRHFNDEHLESILKFLNYKLVEYTRDAMVAFEGDSCDNLGIIISGKVELQSIYPSGKILTLTQVLPGQILVKPFFF